MCSTIIINFIFDSLIFTFTESQNHRIVGVGRDLCGSSSPTLLPKQGHLQQAAQDLVQAGLEYLQRRRLHNLPGQPVPVLRFAKLCHMILKIQEDCMLFLNRNSHNILIFLHEFISVAFSASLGHCQHCL